MSEETLIGQATEGQIATWKKKYGKVFGIKVGGHICYLKAADRKAISYASVAGKSDPLKFNETILNSCFIGGSAEIKTNDELFLGAGKVLPELIQLKEAELVNF